MWNKITALTTRKSAIANFVTSHLSGLQKQKPNVFFLVFTFSVAQEKRSCVTETKQKPINYWDVPFCFRPTKIFWLCLLRWLLRNLRKITAVAVSTRNRRIAAKIAHPRAWPKKPAILKYESQVAGWVVLPCEIISLWVLYRLTSEICQRQWNAEKAPVCHNVFIVSCNFTEFRPLMRNTVVAIVKQNR